jgi:hypothetical protein
MSLKSAVVAALCGVLSYPRLSESRAIKDNKFT